MYTHERRRWREGGEGCGSILHILLQCLKLEILHRSVPVRFFDLSYRHLTSVTAWCPHPCSGQSISLEGGEGGGGGVLHVFSQHLKLESLCRNVRVRLFDLSYRHLTSVTAWCPRPRSGRSTDGVGGPPCSLATCASRWTSLLPLENGTQPLPPPSVSPLHLSQVSGYLCHVFSG